MDVQSGKSEEVSRKWRNWFQNEVDEETKRDEAKIVIDILKITRDRFNSYC